MFLLRKLSEAPRSLALAFIWVYQKTLSPLKNLLLGAFGGTCRFYPTCSCYARECFLKHGFFKGFILTVLRLVKCQPFHPGGIDLPPEEWSLLRVPRKRLIAKKKKSRGSGESRLERL
ncbi:MAG: membrane protein insertion efficiency factor YidD [Opitutales bacterium]|nr:membrane protein insertion efficiency factor YidD [Opitutales bacterium]MCH8539538.1 membrane protein insertion efficiency factor YidD [Opitutales bacterium]